MEKERDGPRVAPEPTMRSDMEDMPELSDTMMALEDESDELVNVPEVRSGCMPDSPYHDRLFGGPWLVNLWV